MRVTIYLTLVACCFSASFQTKAQSITFSTEFLGRANIERALIDTKNITQIRKYIIFAGAYEPVKDYGTQKWYDLVAFHCETGEFKVIFASESDSAPKTMAELLLDRNVAQNDAQIFGHMHGWADMKGLPQTLRRSCGKVQKSTQKYLPFQIGETTRSIWWVDLASLEVSGPIRRVFSFSKQFSIETTSRGGREIQRLEIKPGNELTNQWSLNCAKRSMQTLRSIRNDETGTPVETVNTVGPEESIVPNTVGQLAYEFVCNL